MAISLQIAEGTRRGCSKPSRMQMLRFVVLTSSTTLHIISDTSGHVSIIKRRPKAMKGLLEALMAHIMSIC